MKMFFQQFGGGRKIAQNRHNAPGRTSVTVWVRYLPTVQRQRLSNCLFDGSALRCAMQY